MTTEQLNLSAELWSPFKRGRAGINRTYVLHRRLMPGNRYEWYCGPDRPTVQTLGMLPAEAHVFDSKGEMERVLASLNNR